MGLSSLVVGAASLALALVLGIFQRAEITNAYHWCYLYWWTATVGCYGWAAIFHLTGGAWGVASRPFIDAGMRTLPLMAILFLPIALQVDVLFEWMDPEYFSGRVHVENRRWYLAESFFLARAAGYFVILLILMFVLPRSASGDAARAFVHRSTLFGGLSAVALVLLVSFAAMDWGMSLDPEWYSTLYGGFFIAGGLLLSLCLITITSTLELNELGRSEGRVSELRHDLGKLLLALLMVWGYFAFSQYLIIYAANLPTEAVWYELRRVGIWPGVGWALILLHFALPFAALLSRNMKRRARYLVAVAAYLAIIHVLDVMWLIIPSLDFVTNSLWFGLGSAFAFVGLGGLWIFEFLRQIRRRFVPVADRWPSGRAVVRDRSSAEVVAHD